MQSLRLRALTRKGEPFFFEPADVPVRIWENAFILARRPNTPILQLNTVVRVMDNSDVGEGDCVLINGKEHITRYYRGFYFEDTDGNKIPSNMVAQCEVFSLGTETKSRIQFRSQSGAFQIFAFLGFVEGKILTAHDPHPFYPTELRMSAGFVYQGQKLCYGDLIDGRPLLMWRGRPVIETPEGYLEIPSNKLLGKGELNDGRTA